MSERKKNPHAVALAKLGAHKGGLARAKNLSPEELSEIGRDAARKRWAAYRAAQKKKKVKKQKP